MRQQKEMVAKRRAKVRSRELTQIVEIIEDGTMVWPERDSQVCLLPTLSKAMTISSNTTRTAIPKLPACLDRRRKPELAEADERQ
jgi:hypothetical protein